MNSSNEKKSERITVLAKDFTPAAMEFHRKNICLLYTSDAADE